MYNLVVLVTNCKHATDEKWLYMTKLRFLPLQNKFCEKKLLFYCFFSFHAAEKHCYKYCFSINVTKTNTLIYWLLNKLLSLSYFFMRFLSTSAATIVIFMPFDIILTRNNLAKSGILSDFWEFFSGKSMQKRFQKR